MKSERTAGADTLLSLEVLAKAAECLKIVAHPHRLRMVQMLLRGRYTVGELAAACNIAGHMASEHLRLMQRCGMLESEKEGRKAYYVVVEPHLASIMACIESRFGGVTDAKGKARSPSSKGAGSIGQPAVGKA